MLLQTISDSIQPQQGRQFILFLLVLLHLLLLVSPSSSSSNYNRRAYSSAAPFFPHTITSLTGGASSTRNTMSQKKDTHKSNHLHVNNEREAEEVKGGDNDYEIEIGGGAINEKQRHYSSKQQDSQRPKNDTNADTTPSSSPVTNFDPQNNTSHLLHALIGLDRYPNYLTRWNYSNSNNNNNDGNADIDRLEAALLDQLDKVRKQRSLMQGRNQEVQSLLDKHVIPEYEMQQHHTHEETKENNHDDVDWSILFHPPTTWEELQNRNILHPSASKAIFQSKMFRNTPKRPKLEDVLDGSVVVELDAALLEGWLDQEMFDVYSFPLLSKEFCQTLKRTVQKLVEYSVSDNNNKKNNKDILGSRPVDLDTIGNLSWMNNLLFHLVLRPLSKHLFAQTEYFEDLDWRHGYIAGYSQMAATATTTTTTTNGSDGNIQQSNSSTIISKGVQRERLVAHTDDSEVTLNIGMGDEGFTGGDVAFWGLRGTDKDGKYNGSFHPIIGHALLHSGRHLHEVTEVTNDHNRHAYIIWARSWSGKSRNETCPCCWLNRRRTGAEEQGAVRSRDHGCICSRKWN